jgi:hypothetical protein
MRNEYQEYFLGGKGGRCVELTNVPPSCADCFEIWKPQTPEAFRACLRTAYLSQLKILRQSLENKETLHIKGIGSLF